MPTNLTNGTHMLYSIQDVENLKERLFEDIVVIDKYKFSIFFCLGCIGFIGYSCRVLGKRLGIRRKYNTPNTSKK